MNRPHTQVEIGESCVPNIGLKGRRRRIVMGLFWSAVGIAIFVLLAVRHSTTASFLLMAPVTAYAAVHLFQAKEKT